MATKTDIGKGTTVNLVSKIDEALQKKIANEIIQHYRADLESRSEWEENRARWYKLWACKLDKKTTPWTGSSNVCVPLTANACNQSHARSYQSIFAPSGLVKTLPVGEEDEDRARNVEQFMNWQLQNEMEEYEDVFDRLLQQLPINGVAFKKLFWNKENERPESQYINVLDLIVPYRTKSLETARRITHRLYLHYEELEDRNEAGLYENFDNVHTVGSRSEEADPVRDEADDMVGEQPYTDADEPHVILEIHKSYNLDIDGEGKKPYIFTVDENSGTLLRVTSREYKVGKETKVLNFFIDYHFIPNPDGFYSFGFGHFLEQLNQMANTAFNQIFDAGRLSNTPFFFYGRKAGLKKSALNLEPGKGFEVDDPTQVYFPSMQRVDQTLFQVLAATQQYSETFTSTSDYLSGRESKGTKTPTAHGTLAIIEQGLVTFAVQTKRIFRQFKKELRLIMELNQMFLSDKKEYRIMGKEGVAFPDIKKEDFGGVADIIPIGDPSYASRSTRRGEALELFQTLMPLFQGTPPDENGQGGTPGNEAGTHALIENLLDTYEVKNRSQIHPPLPDKQLLPEDENALFMGGDYKPPVSGEDHEAHMSAHLNFSQSEHFEEMNDDYQDLVMEHIEATKQMIFLDQQLQAQGGIGGVNEEGGNSPVGGGLGDQGLPVEGAGLQGAVLEETPRGFGEGG